MSIKETSVRLDATRLEIPTSHKSFMRVPGLVYCSLEMEDQLFKDNAIEQVANVASLPGIIRASIAMPDIHWGYGFPIGGVAAFDEETGIISPGGVGYDINCGVRLLATDLEAENAKKYIPKIIERLFSNIPSGVGSEGRLKVNSSELRDVLALGSGWAVKNGYGLPEDLDYIEDNGAMKSANPDAISREASKRGSPQLGTLGAGNHFLEVQEVVEIFDNVTASVFGLHKGQLVLLIHTGSRGLGHQVATDYIEVMQNAARMYKIALPDNQLACAPFKSGEGQQYFGAMSAAANYAWANRQMITHWARESLSQALGMPQQKINAKVVYDIAHNIAKKETHSGKNVVVHRKGATRAFPPGYPGLPEKYKSTGHPVLVPGDMGRYSFVMVGTKKAGEDTFASACHGAGRVLSRTQAIKKYNAKELIAELGSKGIFVKAQSSETLTEEAPGAYKDVAVVVDVLHKAGIAKKVAMMKPLGVVKG
jgi:tRNA-splicing ligase RtcB